MHVSRINVVQSFRARDLAGTGKSRRGRVRFVEHFEIGMERCEMPRHIEPEIFCEPFRRAMQLCVAVILTGDQQCRDFEPNIRFVSQIFQRVEDRLDLSKT